MNMGETSTQMSIEDPNQPDWAKFKSLREIEMIRETKKEDVISKVLNDYVSNVQLLNVIPGKLQFVTIPIHNAFAQNEVYTIHISDPDSTFLQSPEITLVSDASEWRHWIQEGRCRQPDQLDCVTHQGDVILKPNA